jgi:predicted membrane-bound mannosyltransferase
MAIWGWAVLTAAVLVALVPLKLWLFKRFLRDTEPTEGEEP